MFSASMPISTLRKSGNTSPPTTIDAADRWIVKLFDAFEALGSRPGMGHKREDLNDYPALFWPVGSYVIIYRAEHRPIEIVAVTQGSRDIPAFLRRRLH
jgi:plasmid stabilization system protein ParE